MLPFHYLRKNIGVCATLPLFVFGQAAADSVFSATSGPSCLNLSKYPDDLRVNTWRCPGPGGYVVEFADEGNIAGIGFAKGRLRDSKIDQAASWRGAGKVFGNKLQWVMQDGKPGAVILRIWRIDTREDGDEQEVQELAVFRLEPTRARQYATVNARQPSANAIAEQQALDALRSSCPEK
jgi:hypothetical protein